MAENENRKYPGKFGNVISGIFQILREEATGVPHVHACRQFVAAFRRARVVHGDARQRLELEALILADQPRLAIASRMALDETTIAAFELAFFDVRKSLDSRLLVQTCLEVEEASGTSALRRVVLRHSYDGGVLAADQWLQHLHALGDKHDLRTPEGRERERLELFVLMEEIEMGNLTVRPTVYAELVAVINSSPAPVRTVAEMVRLRTEKLAAKYAPIWQQQLNEATQEVVEKAAWKGRDSA